MLLYKLDKRDTGVPLGKIAWDPTTKTLLYPLGMTVQVDGVRITRTGEGIPGSRHLCHGTL
jgi:hypothetical protein